MHFTKYKQSIERFEILLKVRKVRVVLKHVIGLKMCVLCTA